MTPDPDVKYQAHMKRPGDADFGLHDVEGVQVGRLAVRYEYRANIGGAGELPMPPGWIVDHMGSHLAIYGPVETFAYAMVIADDVSRFAPQDLSAESMEGLIDQLGPDVLDWLDSITWGHVVPYRKWRAERDAA